MSQARPEIRKRLLDAESTTSPGAQGEIDCAVCATIAYSSEDPAHPVEHLLDGRSGAGATRWISGRADVAERIVLAFDRPQSISRLIYEVEETERERTQEVRVEVSSDDGQTYRQILVQDYTFSPGGATFQREDLRFELQDVSRFRLIVIPNKNGSGRATLSSLRLFA